MRMMDGLRRRANRADMRSAAGVSNRNTHQFCVICQFVQVSNMVRDDEQPCNLCGGGK